MNAKTVASLILALSALTTGCTDDTGGDDSPLIWNPPDSSIPPRPDAATTARPDAGSRTCIPFDQLPEEALPRCRASTLQCVSACPMDGTQECRNGCVGADDTAPLVPETGDPIDCASCLFRQSLACMADNGCQNQVDAFLCCIVDECIGGPEGCIAERCQEQITNMYACGAAYSPVCFSDTQGDMNACYADSDPPPAQDAGATDPDAGMGGML